MVEMKEFKEYSKHWPWYAKLSRGRNWQNMMCKLDKHIPAKAMPGEEVCCQDCVKELTLADWNKFWKGT